MSEERGLRYYSRAIGIAGNRPGQLGTRSHLTLNTQSRSHPYGRGSVFSPRLQMGALRPREVKWLPPNHTARRLRNWYLNPRSFYMHQTWGGRKS